MKSRATSRAGKRNESARLKRAVLTEELYAITGDDLSAIVLRQMLYWAPRTNDLDEFLREETERSGSVVVEFRRGWIYKSAKELKGEIMSDRSEDTIRRRLAKLVEQGWLQERPSPHAWDRSRQYRVDLLRIEEALQLLGYTLATVMNEDYPLVRRAVESSVAIPHGAASIPHGAVSKPHHAGTIPEITSETTAKNNDTESAGAIAPDAPAPQPSPRRRKPRLATNPTSQPHLLSEAVNVVPPTPSSAPPPSPDAARALPEAAPKPPKPSAHPAVQAWRAAKGRYPATEQMPEIISVVGEGPEALAWWEECLRAHVRSGGKPTNAATPLTWFVDKRIPAHAQLAPLPPNPNSRSNGPPRETERSRADRAKQIGPRYTPEQIAEQEARWAKGGQGGF